MSQNRRQKKQEQFRRKYIKKQLEKLDMVEWDRLTQPEQHYILFYGWIPREEDSYKDFVVIEVNFQEGGTYLVATSSDEYSEEIAEQLDNEGHTECERVEDNFPEVDNAVNL